METNKILNLRDSLSGFSNLLREIAEDKLDNFTSARFEISQNYVSGDLHLLGMVIIPALPGEPDDKMQEFIKEYCKDDHPISRSRGTDRYHEYQALFIDNTKFFNKTFGILPTEFGKIFA